MSSSDSPSRKAIERFGRAEGVSVVNFGGVPDARLFDARGDAVRHRAAPRPAKERFTAVMSTVYYKVCTIRPLGTRYTT
jgi:hypothetical protein